MRRAAWGGQNPTDVLIHSSEDHGEAIQKWLALPGRQMGLRMASLAAWVYVDHRQPHSTILRLKLVGGLSVLSEGLASSRRGAAPATWKNAIPFVLNI